MEEDFFNVTDARVVWADYDHLSRKLSSSRKTTLSHKDIDLWLYSNFALLTRPHTIVNPLHEAPKTSGVISVGFRPIDYGRAAVFQSEIGLVDVKGLGVPSNIVPSFAPYKTGLLYLYEAVIEVFTQRFIRRMLESSVGESTVRTLAIIQLPIRLRSFFNSDQKIECGLLVREFHPRYIDSRSYQDPWIIQSYLQEALEWEMRVRNFGLTSGIFASVFEARASEFIGRRAFQNDNPAPALNDYFSSICEGLPSASQLFVPINIQLSKSLDRSLLIDFNGFRHQKRFSEHSLVGFGPSYDRQAHHMLSTDGKFVRKPSSIDPACKFLKVREIAGTDCFGRKNKVRSKVLHLLTERILEFNESISERSSVIQELIKCADGGSFDKEIFFGVNDAYLKKGLISALC